MLKHRLLVGFPMAGAALGLLWADATSDFPGLALLALAVGLIATVELRLFFPRAVRPPKAVVAGVLLVLLSAAVAMGRTSAHEPPPAWWPQTAALTGSVLLLLLWELWVYTADGATTARAANGVFTLVYLGLLPSFLIRLRFAPTDAALWAVVATIFVPKVGDIGAYFTGRLIGRHPMAPAISPKKTWEGFAGGMVAAAGTAVGASFAAPTLFRHGPAEAVAFGLVVGVAGVLGDLFESLLKRDAQVKDAAKSVPGFGGVLDVIDSVLFAAPVAYLWFGR